MSIDSTTSAEALALDASLLIEEELVRGYKPEHYYPAKIGQLLQERYLVIGKLGYGSASTVWLCRDTRGKHEFVALKLYINISKVHRELPVYEHLNRLGSKHGGFIQIRQLLDSFEVFGPKGKHRCLVHEALGMNMEELKELVPNERFEPDLIRQSMRDILRGLHFLHTEAKIIHADIQPKNILLGVLDNNAFLRFEEDEISAPMPRKELPDRKLYVSRPMPLSKGAPKLCDLSEARFEQPENIGRITPDVYRAPEVILSHPWDYAVDVWGLATTLWDLFEPKRLFSPHNGNGHYSEQHHLAQMVSLMGPPPPDFLQKSSECLQFWDAEGNWRDAVPIPTNSLEDAEQRLQGEEKALFLKFMRKMLQWRPSDRPSVEDLFMDEWLLADLVEAGEVVREEG